jgi:hypothetical protein
MVVFELVGMGLVALFLAALVSGHRPAASR